MIRTNLPTAVLICVLWTVPGSVFGQEKTPSSRVDPLIGTKPNPILKMGYSWDTGNVFPGTVCPRGLVAFSPDTTHQKNIAGGYWYPDDKIEDFSLTHFSGRGVPCLRDIAFMPLVRMVEHSPGMDWTQTASAFSHTDESASPGRYEVKFDNGIRTELAATLRTGMARFTFPAQAPGATLLIRADGAISVHGNEVSGRADWKPGRPKVYFFAQFARPFSKAQTWVGDQISDAPAAEDKKCGAILSFDVAADAVVPMRVGISYTSAENARENLTRENSGWDLAAVQNAAARLWDHELGRVEIGGGTDDQTKIFYTALYHCLIHPNILDDVNGQYPGMDGKVHTVANGHHQYQNIPAWDQRRSHSPLMAILAPAESSDVMQSLVNYAQQDASVHPDGGGLPRWEQVNTNSGGMVGDGDDTIIASSYAFGATDFDTKAAFAAMDKGASQPGVTSDGHKVRDGLEAYMRLGYVPEKAAVTLEYCNDDFALSQFASAIGEKEKAQMYLRRAQNWKNLFNPANGYLCPRLADGSWADKFSPDRGTGFVEGTAAQYFWLVNFNLRALIDQIGGNEKAVARLDAFFTQLNAGMRTPFAYMGNETNEEIPWVYNFAGAPWRTQDVVRRVETELFTSDPSGLPGNDDAGSLSSWYIFAVLGLYPEIPGVAGFAVGSPLFPKAVLHLENGKTISIIGEGASAENRYVQGLKINGSVSASPWIPWPMLSGGGTVSFELGPNPAPWGKDPHLAPPSFDAPAVR